MSLSFAHVIGPGRTFMDGPTIELTLARAPVPAPSFGRFSFGLAGPKAFASKILRRMVAMAFLTACSSPTKAAKARANTFREQWRRYEFGRAIVESKRWARPLCRKAVISRLLRARARDRKTVLLQPITRDRAARPSGMTFRFGSSAESNSRMRSRCARSILDVLGSLLKRKNLEQREPTSQQGKSRKEAPDSP
jgi:hypothetical protein